ncbi:MAG: hypothetical protein HY696_09355 [Deltaproteobacteria bacterium]|nr:hypothetical protein [Deltaproteobacteria bacterium]
MTSRRHTTRGSTLVELVLALPLFLAGLLSVVWFAVRGVEKLVSVYAMFIGIRAASVQVADGDLVASWQMDAIDSRARRWQQLAPPWRLGHVPQPVGHAAPQGDNPLP